MGEHEERPWPENAWPTPQQWLDWFFGQPRGDLLGHAETVVEALQGALACHTHQHAARLADAEARAEAAERDLRIEADKCAAANARAERWKQRTDDARAQVARIELLRATLPHAIDCGVPCSCWKRWTHEALRGDQ